VPESLKWSRYENEMKVLLPLHSKVLEKVNDSYCCRLLLR
jgi:hypothetical protein